MKTISYRSFASGLGVVLLAACSDATAPIAAPSAVNPVSKSVTAVACTVSVSTESVSCAGPSSAPSSLAANKGVSPQLIVGGQNTNVTLASSNFVRSAGAISFDVTVKNLIEQPLGTLDGSTVDANGIRVFFAGGPTPISGGTVTVQNADGTAMFLGSNQPYFKYNVMLQQGQTTPAKTWQFALAGGATDFTFTVYVAAEALYPNGYVANVQRQLILDPNETAQLTGVARSAYGRPTGAAVTYTMDTTTGPSVTSAGLVSAGAVRGVAHVRATSGLAPAIAGAGYVSVCQSTVVASGASVNASLDASDCWSSLHRNDGFLPGTSYYGDLYRITLQAGDQVTITMSAPNSSLDPELVLADSFGAPVAANDDISSNNLDSQIIYTVPAAGRYVIQATSFMPRETGAYNLAVTVNGAIP